MAINSDAFQYDMSGWVREKSLGALKNACRLSDWLHKEDNLLPEKDREAVAGFVAGVIWNTVKLYMFGCENDDVPVRRWSGLLLAQGSARLEEFLNLVRGNVPSDAQPAEYPQSVQRVLDLFNDATTISEDGDASPTLVRRKVIELGEELAKVQNGALSIAGKSLLDLVDQQTYHASISWEDFAARCKRLVKEARTLYLERMKRYRWEPDDEFQKVTEVENWEKG